MTRPARFLAALAGIVLALSVAPARADCTVSYKAKKDEPLQLQAGSAKVPDEACASEAAAADAVRGVIEPQGWTLLAITGMIGSN